MTKKYSKKSTQGPKAQPEKPVRITGPTSPSHAGHATYTSAGPSGHQFYPAEYHTLAETSYVQPGPVPRTYIVDPLCGPVCAPMCSSSYPPMFQTSCPPVCPDSATGKKVDFYEHERVVRGLEHNIRDMENRLSDYMVLQERCHSYEGRLHELGALQNNVHGLQAENRRLEQLVHQLECRNNECGRMQNDLAQVTDKCSRLANENRQMDNELRDALRSRDDLLRERDSMSQEFARMQRELSQGAAGVHAVKSQMQIRITELESELQGFLTTLRTRDMEVHDLTAQLQAKDAELQRLLVNLRDRDAMGADFERLKADNIALIRELERSAEDIRRLEMEVGRLREEIAELMRENERLLTNAHSRPMLGVEIKMLDDAAGRHDNVVVVHTVTPHGPADLAGILPGDIIKEWDGVQLDSKRKFQRMLDQSPPGTRCVLSIVRGRSILDIPVAIGATSAGKPNMARRVRSETQVDNVIQDPVIPSSMGHSRLMGRPPRYGHDY